MAAARWRHLGLAFAAPALVIPLAAAPAHAVQAPPSPTRPLPSALDVRAPYQGQTVCDPTARPGVLDFARLMTTHYGMGSTGLIGRTCTAASSEHYDGRAWDWMLNVGNAGQEAVAQSVLTWLTRADSQGVQGGMARRFGIMYIIHNRKMWRAYAPERGWAPYYGSSPHTDHVHFSFTYDGAAGRTSWWTGVATTSYLTTLPPAAGTVVATAPSTPRVLSYGMTSEAVRTLQAKLGALPTSGWYGPMTKARVIAFQKHAGLPQTGVADVDTQKRLATKGWTAGASTTPTPPGTYPTLTYGMTSSAVRTLQAKLGALPTSGWYGPMTKARVIAFQRYAGLSQTGVADSATQARLRAKGWTGGATTPTPEPTPTPTPKPMTYPTLAYGTTSSAVKALQAALGSLPTTGWYGPMTKARVVAYQRFVGLSRTGVADHRTQQLLHTRGWSTATTASLTTSTAPAGGPNPITEGPAMTVMHAMTAPVPGGASASPAFATVSTATGFTAYQDLVIGLGSRGAAVRTLQRGLGGLAIDGVFGAVTQEKVCALQRANGWAPTGVVTSEVWSALEARAYPFVANRTSVLRAGDEGPHVVAVQRLLGVRPTGVFDGATQEAVKRAQAGAGLASTGVVASRTWSLFDRLSA